MTEDEIHTWLCRHYVQEADARQRAIGLSYTTAETRDLARQIKRLMDKAARPTPPLRTEGGPQA